MVRAKPPKGAQIIPWNSIAEGVVDYGETKKSFAEGMDSPCATCTTSPCCTHLPLHTFRVTNMIELDHARYLLNFDRIELGLNASGDWGVYYVYPCRFLDRGDLSCTVHATPEQPQICVQYNPYNCWYKRSLTRSVGDEFLQIDRPRFEYILSQVQFDEFRNITSVPDWAAMVEAMRDVTATPPPVMQEPPASDPPFDSWREAVRTGVEERDPPARLEYGALADPCTGCAASCCETLVFPQASLPTTISMLDYFRFALGFPGVELGLADDSWALVVKTRCRHLEGTRCGIYGTAERPLICKYYDAWKCTYRINFGLPRPPGFLRLRFEQWEWLTECFRFDEFGHIVEFPGLADIRGHIEARWHSALAEPAAAPEEPAAS